jgi:DNA-binding transcriptional LysR family regulator
MRLPPILIRYREDFPDVDIVIRTGTTQELIEAVLQHKLEGAFVAGHADDPELTEEVMFPEELVLIGAYARPPLEALTGSGPVELLVLKSGCSYRNKLEAILAARGDPGAGHHRSDHRPGVGRGRHLLAAENGRHKGRIRRPNFGAALASGCLLRRYGFYQTHRRLLFEFGQIPRRVHEELAAR